MVPAENEDALSAELELMYQNPNLLGQKSEYALNHVQKFSVQNLKINLQNLFSEDL
jgi:spore coat protein CotF